MSHTSLFKPVLLCLLLLAAAPLWAQWGGRVETQSMPAVPLYFEANAGQLAPQVRYLARAPGYQLYLAQKEVVWRLHDRWPDTPRPGHPGVIRLHLDGASGVQGEGRLSHVSNYYIGNDPRRWRQAVPAYGRVVYQGVYPGIDLVFHGQGQQLEYDFRLAPGADPGAIALDFQGAERLGLDDSGALVLESGDMHLVHHRPRAYQEVDGLRRPVTAAYHIADGRVSFRLGTYDPALPLVIDPVVTVSYGAYLGGGGQDEILDMAVDASGNVYVTGRTDSTDFPGVQAGTPSGTDAFVSKFDATGKLLFSVYLGGMDTSPTTGDVGRAITVDSSGDIYVAGDANFQFPVTPSAFDSTANASSSNAFVAVLDSRGGLNYASYYGGGGRDEAHAIAVDSQGVAYVAGLTRSRDLPLAHAYQSAYGGIQDAFLMVLDPSAAGAGGLLYASYFGGASADAARALALKSAGQVYMAGESNSAGLGTPGSYAPAPVQPGGAPDAFIVHFDTSLTGAASLRAGTYLGGTDPDASDRARGLALGMDGSIYVVGTTMDPTMDPGFPVSINALDGVFAGDSEAFLTVFSTDLKRLDYATFLGGSGDETGESVAVDGAGMVYLVGSTTSADFPGTAVRLADFPYRGGKDGFLVAVDASRKLSYGIYLGGGNDDSAQAVATGGAGTIQVAGWTESVDFTMANAGAGLAGFHGGFRDGFLLGLSETFGSGDTVSGGSGSGGGGIVITDGSGSTGSGGSGGGSGGGVLSWFVALLALRWASRCR